MKTKPKKHKGCPICGRKPDIIFDEFVSISNKLDNKINFILTCIGHGHLFQVSATAKTKPAAARKAWAIWDRRASD